MQMAAGFRGETREALGPIAYALNSRASREMLDEIDRRAAQIIAKIQASHGFAEVVSGVEPHWFLALVFAGKERLAADELRDRGFGTYVPEVEASYIRRGRKIERLDLLMHGYLLFFMWPAEGQLQRIRACEGVRDVLFSNGKPAIVSDRLVNLLRAVENSRRPLKRLVAETPSGVPKKPKKRWRQSVKPIDEHDNDVVGVHAYSAYVEELRKELANEQASEVREAFNRW